MTNQRSKAQSGRLHLEEIRSGPTSYYPDSYRVIARSAKQGQGFYFRLIQVQLIAIVVAALTQFVAQPFAHQIAASRQLVLGSVRILGFTFSSDAVTNAVVTSFITSFPLLTAILLAAVRVFSRLNETWHSRGAVAEAVASLAWRYSMNALPGDLSGASPNTLRGDAEYAAAYRNLLQEASSSGVQLPQSRGETITQEMRDLRLAAAPEKRITYLTRRLDDKLDFYRTHSKHSVTSQKVINSAMLACYCIGALLMLFNGLGAMATIAGALGTWGSVKVYTEQIQSYGAMARILEVMRARGDDMPLEGPSAATQWTQFVDRVETLLEGGLADWLRHSQDSWAM